MILKILTIFSMKNALIIIDNDILNENVFNIIYYIYIYSIIYIYTIYIYILLYIYISILVYYIIGITQLS